MGSTATFPRFWFESNQRWGYVGTIPELLEMLDAQPDMTRAEVLERARCVPDNAGNFGLRAEHTGALTLAKHLETHGVDVSPFISTNTASQ